jgi:tetratricopeptide (TPR) repeat protein
MRFVITPLLIAALMMSVARAESTVPLLECSFGSLDAKIAACTKVIEARQLDAARMALAHNNRGRWYVEKKEPDKAIADFTRAIELDPKMAEAYSGRAVVHFRAGRKEQAIADFRKTLDYNPNDGLARELLRSLGANDNLPPPTASGGGGDGPFSRMH